MLNTYARQDSGELGFGHKMPSNRSFPISLHVCVGAHGRIPCKLYVHDMLETLHVMFLRLQAGFKAENHRNASAETIVDNK